jgi:hypothetical protein
LIKGLSHEFIHVIILYIFSKFKFKYQCLKCFSDSIGNELNEHIKDEESDSEVKF